MAIWVTQHRDSGQIIDVYENDSIKNEYWPKVQAWDKEKNVILVNTTNKSKLSVEYVEMGGPWGYGHQETSFETYGSLLECVRRFYNWVFETARVFGPDWRDVYDYFRNCSLTINGESYNDWFRKEKERINKDKIYI